MYLEGGHITRASLAYFDLYRQVADQVEKLIKEGTLGPETYIEVARKIVPLISLRRLFCTREHVELYLPTLVIQFLTSTFTEYVRSVKRENKKNLKLKCSKRDLKIRS